MMFSRLILGGVTYIIYIIILLLQPQVAVYYESLRMAVVGCELNSETRGIDVTRRAELIGEGIRV